MTVEISSLALAVDSTQVLAAEKALDKLDTSGKRVSITAELLKKSYADMGGAVGATTKIVAAGTDNASASVRKGRAEMDKFGNSAGQTANALRMVPAQLTDITTQLAGGQSPFLVMIQQGGQLRDMFGGFRPMFAGMTSMITPTAVAVGSLAGALGGLYLAQKSGAEASKAFNDGIKLTGGYAGVTEDYVLSLADSLGKLERAGTGVAHGVLNELVKSGRFTYETLGLAGEAAIKLSKYSGESTEEIVKHFSRMSNGVAKWGVDANKQYHFLTLKQYEHIRALEDQGKKTEAMRLMFDALNKSIPTQVESLGWLEKSWRGVADAVKSAWEGMKSVGRAQTTGDKIKQTDGQIAMLEGDLKVARGKGDPGAKAIQNRINELNVLRASLTAASEQETVSAMLTSDAKAKEAAAIEQSAEAHRKHGQTTSATLQAELAMLEGGIKKKKGLLEGEITDIAQLRAIGFLSQDEALQKEHEAREANLTSERATVEKMLALKGLDVKERTNLQTRVAEINQQIVNDGKKYTLEVTTQANARERAIKSYTDALNVQLSTQRKAVSNAVDAVGRGDRSSSLNSQINQINGEYDRQQRELAGQTSGPNAISQDEYAAKLTALQQYRNDAIAIVRDGDEQVARAQGNWLNGATRAWENYLDSASNVAQQTNDMFTRGFKGMEDALVEFAMTGKLNFKSLANSIIADMVRIQARQAMSQLFGGGSGGGGLGSIIGAIAHVFTGGTSTVVANPGLINSAKGNVFDDGAWQRFADGGAFTNGIVSKPTKFNIGLMGEAGPEAIMPLARGVDGSLGVKANGGGGNNVSKTINLTYAPVINIDSRTDRNEVYANVQRMLQSSQAEMRDRMAREGI